MYSRDGEKRYFEVFDEAIVGLLEKGFYEDVIRKSDLFREELEKNPDFKLVLNRQPELDDLNMLVDELWSRNNEQFSDREQIVDMFVEAHVNGHLLKIGRLIESTFGKGSFRDFADDADSYEDKGGVESKAE